jgi:hypothetical protein
MAREELGVRRIAAGISFFLFLGLGDMVILELRCDFTMPGLRDSRSPGRPFFMESSSTLRSIFMLVRRRGERIIM